MHHRTRILWIAAGIAVSLMLPICGSLICRLVLADFSFSHLPVHSLVESLGGLMAVAIAAILIAERTRRDDADHFVWMAMRADRHGCARSIPCGRATGQ